jgi:hypothetical protein
LPLPAAQHHKGRTFLAHLERAFVHVGERLNGIDPPLDTMDRMIQSRLGRIEYRFVAAPQRSDWLTGVVTGTWITTISTILLHR